MTVLHDSGLLGTDVLLSHANHISADELSQVKASGAHLSSTPVSELQMGHGHPVCLQPEFLPLSSVGTDSNSICSSSIAGQLETVLQASRARRLEEQTQSRTWDGTIGPSAEEAYNLRTILGAQAIGLGNEIGSLAIGKKADIVLFDSKTPAMLVAAHVNPVAAIILHSSVRDVQTVIVDGVVRKQNSSLNRVVIPQDISSTEDTSDYTSPSCQWYDVAREVEESRMRIQKIRAELVDEDAARTGLIRSFMEAMKLSSEI